MSVIREIEKVQKLLSKSIAYSTASSQSMDRILGLNDHDLLK